MYVSFLNNYDNNKNNNQKNTSAKFSVSESWKHVSRNIKQSQEGCKKY